MSTTQRSNDEADRMARLVLETIGRELREARIDRALSQSELAAGCGTSQSTVSRIERSEERTVPIPLVSRLIVAVGLRPSFRAFPGGNPIRDAAHRALLERLRERTSNKVRWAYEVPLPIQGDLRAWDATITLDRQRIAVEAETHPRDVQALQRRLGLKRRDDPRIAHVVLLLSDTTANRQLVRDNDAALLADFPVPAAETLRNLAAARELRGSGIVLL